MNGATLADLHLMLMEQASRLMDCEAGSDEQAAEVERSQSMSSLASAINANVRTVMKAAEATDTMSKAEKLLLGGA